MYGICYGACIQGIEGKMIRVEIDLSNGLPLFSIVGLPDSAVRESTERVRAALKNGSYEFPMRRITVNLAPADVRKEGASFDLAIAVGILITSGQWPHTIADHTMFLGELSLLGDVRPVPGVLSMVHAAREAGLRRVVVPWDNAKEASLIEGIQVCPVKRLREVQEGVNDEGLCLGPEGWGGSPQSLSPVAEQADFSDVLGQQQAKRALAIAAAGMHNVLFIGPPGSGKTMLMRRLPTVMPPLSDEEALEVTKIYSASGQLVERGALVRMRPYRSPHHSISPQGLIGGGALPRPGEVSLAHRGVLFLDELPEFPRAVLESLRQPMEDGTVTIARAKSTHTFPARFILAATMNPCPCGYDGYEDEFRSCSCKVPRKLAYLSRLSGPLLDRIDIVMDVPRMRADEVAQWSESGTPEDGEFGPEGSIKLARKVAAARQAQAERFQGTTIRSNAEMNSKALREFCRLDDDAAKRLVSAYRELGLSARAHDRVLKVARTIADFDRSESIRVGHMNEALLFRALDLRKKRWTEMEGFGGVAARGGNG
jgi:magnesium chelatase family protein